MRVVQILEKDPKSQVEIAEALLAIDPKIHVRIFSSIEEYALWIPRFVRLGAAAVFQGGVKADRSPEPEGADDHPEVNLIVVDSTLLGEQHIGLIKRTRELYVRKQACQEGQAPSLIVTAFESPEFNIKTWILPEINNLIFKPFDRLILSQHLIHALDGRNPPSSYTISNQKAESKMEILKDVQLIQHTDIGFRTLSDRPIPVGSLSKYYAEPWKTNFVRSVLARVKACQSPNGSNGPHIVDLEFFGLEPSQITSIRKLLFKRPVVHPLTGDKKSLSILNLDKNCEDAHPWLKDIGCITLSSPAEFFFHLEPDKAIQDLLPKAVSGEKKSVDLWITDEGEFFKSFMDESATHLLGLSVEELKKIKFSSLIDPKLRSEYRKLLVSENGTDHLFSVRIGAREQLVKFARIGADKEAGLVLLQVTVPSSQEAADWYRKRSSIPQDIKVVLVPQALLGEGFEPRWTALKEKLTNLFGTDLKLVVIAEKFIPEAEELKMAEIFDELFYFPIDKSYFLLKVSNWFSQFKAKESPEGIRALDLTMNVKAANPVHVSEISEAGLIIKYNRKMDIGTYREFVLWQPYELDAPELLAAVNFSEESGDPELPYLCHLVFFGIRDQNLKSIRLWIMDNYVLGKESKG